MKIVGLVVEYNPFHNGHLYHIEEARKITGADVVVVVMSGDFVQRGAPAIMPKHMRAKMALHCGASLVIELPVRFATGSAEYFATGAISLLHQLGCVDAICFGSECGDMKVLSLIADILLEEPLAFRQSMQEYLRLGLSFPMSRQKALARYLESKQYTEELGDILSNPNNILGIEYLKALRLLKSAMTPYTIMRTSSNYHDSNLQDQYSSASAIRNQFRASKEAPEFLTSLQTQVPYPCYAMIEENLYQRYPIFTDDFSLLLHQKLLNETKESLLKYQDVNAELASRILKFRNSFLSIDQFCMLLNSKNITYTRISRALTHILLNISNYETLIECQENTCEWHSYIHILGFRKTHDTILREIKERSALPLLTKLTSIHTLSPRGQEMITEDIYASNLYESVVTNKYKTPFIHELEKSLILL